MFAVVVFFKTVVPTWDATILVRIHVTSTRDATTMHGRHPGLLQHTQQPMQLPFKGNVEHPLARSSINAHAHRAVVCVNTEHALLGVEKLCRQTRADMQVVHPLP